MIPQFIYLGGKKDTPFYNSLVLNLDNPLKLKKITEPEFLDFINKKNNLEISGFVLSVFADYSYLMDKILNKSSNLFEPRYDCTPLDFYVLVTENKLCINNSIQHEVLKNVERINPSLTIIVDEYTEQIYNKTLKYNLDWKNQLKIVSPWDACVLKKIINDAQ